MDPITHPMTGVLIGSLAARERRLLYPLALTGFVAAMMPDLDVVALAPLDWLMDRGLISAPDPDWLTAWGLKPHGRYYDALHRVFTHNVFLALTALPLLGALPGWLWARSRFLLFLAVAEANIAAHLLMDWPCNHQLLLFWPMSGVDYANGHPWFHFPPFDTSIPVMVTVILGALVALYLRSNQPLKPVDQGGG